MRKNEIKAKLDEYKSLMGNTDAASEKKKEDLLEWLKANQCDELREIGGQWSEECLTEIKTEVMDIRSRVLRQQMDDKAYKLIPWSYIAREYFGKSVGWLTQRINGYPVRGRVYTLNEDQKQILNRAMAEIGKFIGSYRFA